MLRVVDHLRGNRTMAVIGDRVVGMTGNRTKPELGEGM